MTEQKDFESLDELFRKTFDNLPDTPAKSGWDTPTERVWQHVQKEIRPPRTGWSAQALTLIAAFAVTLAVGLYLYFNRPAQPEVPATAPAATTAETAQQEPANAAEPGAEIPQGISEAPPVLPERAGHKKTAPAKKPVPRNSMEIEAAKSLVTDSNASKAVERERNAPNTTLRRKAELAKRAEQAWKTPLPPLPQRWPGKSKN